MRGGRVGTLNVLTGARTDGRGHGVRRHRDPLAGRGRRRPAQPGRRARGGSGHRSGAGRRLRLLARRHGRAAGEAADVDASFRRGLRFRGMRRRLAVAAVALFVRHGTGRPGTSWGPGPQLLQGREARLQPVQAGRHRSRTRPARRASAAAERAGAARRGRRADLDLAERRRPRHRSGVAAAARVLRAADRRRLRADGVPVRPGGDALRAVADRRAGGGDADAGAERERLRVRRRRAGTRGPGRQPGSSRSRLALPARRHPRRVVLRRRPSRGRRRPVGPAPRRSHLPERRREHDRAGRVRQPARRVPPQARAPAAPQPLRLRPHLAHDPGARRRAVRDRRRVLRRARVDRAAPARRSPGHDLGRPRLRRAQGGAATARRSPPRRSTATVASCWRATTCAGTTASTR